MSESKKSSLASWIPVAITVVGWVFMGGMAYSKLNDHERRIIKSEADHDTVIEMKQKVSDIHDWVKAMRERGAK